MTRKLLLLLKAIRFEHTLFALPFALLSGFVAAHGVPSARQLSWILVAMVAARSSGMAVNRLADLEYDRRNPRTASWPVPAGLISPRALWIFAVCCAHLLFVAAAMLNRLALYLSPVAIAVMWGYSYLKRYTALSHFALGLVLAIAPVGAWIGVTGSIGFPAILLGLIVVLWTAGFDIIYACQDVEFDRQEGLRSAPCNMGVGPALALSAGAHLVMLGLLLWFEYLMGLGTLFRAGIAVAALLLIYQHSIVRPSDLSRVNAAFFTANGTLSVALFVLGAADILR